MWVRQKERTNILKKHHFSQTTAFQATIGSAKIKIAPVTAYF
jgi:hypothetical protein